MELNTLGAALQWGFNLEDHLIMLCERTIELGNGSGKRSSILSILSKSKRRKATLQRHYNENVYSDMDSGIFEPIGKLEADDYLLSDQKEQVAVPTDAMDIEHIMEQKIARFYNDLASSLSRQRRSLIQEFKKMAAECCRQDTTDQL